MRAIAIAIAASVTVSMLALRIGICNWIRAVKRVTVSTSWRETTGERLGTSSTSSKVRPFWERIFIDGTFLDSSRSEPVVSASIDRQIMAQQTVSAPSEWAKSRLGLLSHYILSTGIAEKRLRVPCG